MGSHQFQKEYIEYLQERNLDLLKKLSLMKENYDNKILSKDLNKQYIISIFEDVLKVCSTLPQEIDSFFDKMTAAMGVLTNILIKKSEMLQIAEKISNFLSPADFNTDSEERNYRNFLNEQILPKNIEKKGGTVKVSPMVSGHVIVTDPRIYLNRVSEDTLYNLRKGPGMLSPIVEASPDRLASPLRKQNIYKEARVPLQRLCLNKLPFKISKEASPKSKQGSPKILSQNEESDMELNSEILKEKENINGFLGNKSVNEEKNEECGKDIDPLEGPSWLYDDNSLRVSSPSSVKPTCYIDFKRRKHRFATVFEKNKDSKRKSSGFKKRDSLNRSTRNDSTKFLEVDEFKNNDASQDLISESSDNEESNSCSDNILSNNRKCINESSDEHDFEDFAVGLNNDMSTPYSTNNMNENYKKNNLSDEISENRSSTKKFSEKRQSNLSYKERRLSKSSPKSEESNKSRSFVSITPISKIKKKKKSTTRKNTLKKQKLSNIVMEEVVVKLEDCKSSNEFKAMLIRASNPNDGEIDCRPNGSWGSYIFENEGRKKRKAAPTNLTEPKLTTKLRRG